MNTDNPLISKEKFESGLLRLTLNNPQSKNALSKDMISSLMNSINAAFNDHSIKVIIIGASGNVFCAGHDLKEITEARESEDSGDRYYKDLFDSCSSLMQVSSDHIAIRTSHYSGIEQQNANVKVYGLNYVIRQLESEDSLLIVDDVHDTGLSIQQIIKDLNAEKF